MRKKVLIVGNSATGYALAKKMSEKHDIYITAGARSVIDFATIVDIRESNPNELLKFALENNIDMTIPVSEEAILSDIVSIFSSNEQQIFGPVKPAAEIILNKASVKKFLYKLRVSTPKFGIFDKENSALEYINNQKIPFVIKTNDKYSSVILTSANQAKSIVSSCFTDRNMKLIVEDYVYGIPFSYYAITDGYKALPIGSSITYKHSLEGNGGQLTSGMGACSPNYKISVQQEYYLMDEVIYTALKYFENGENPYVGIIGVNGILCDDGKISILGYESFLQDCDSTNIINLINDDLYELFEACIIGSFSDEFDCINVEDSSAVSLTLRAKYSKNESNVISGNDSISDNIITTYYPNVTKNKYMEYEAPSDSVMILAAKSSTPAGAARKVYQEVNDIHFCGKRYRTDICKI